MEKETFEWMEAMVCSEDNFNFKVVAESLIRDLKEDGFEDNDIFEYLTELIKGVNI